MLASVTIASGDMITLIFFNYASFIVALETYFWAKGNKSAFT